MGTLRLIALALLFHEILYLSSKGSKHLTDAVAPVLGLRLAPATNLFTHAAFVVTSVVLMLYPAVRLVPLASLIILSVVIASFPRRLPNHLAVAWFFLLAFTVARLELGQAAADGAASDSFGLGAIQVMTVLTYCIAAFHKLNRDYFNPRVSCGTGLLVHYLLQKGVDVRGTPRYAAPLGIYAVVGAEVLLPLLLVIDATQQVGLWLALALHLVFGLFAHIPLSVIMYAGLLAFLPNNRLFEPLTGIAVVPLLLWSGSAVIAGHVLGNHRRYVWPRLAWANHCLFVACTIMVAHAVAVSASTRRSGLANAAWHEAPLPFALIVGGFIVNGMSPYLGLKFDFSLAMFSNLRPDRWAHYVIARPLFEWSPRYVQVVGFTFPRSEETLREQALKRFEELFPSRRFEHYALGYVAAALARLSMAGVREVAIQCTDPTSGESFFVDAMQSWPVLTQRDRLSVYPYAVPSSEEDSLCR
jgi:hypothetical protein